LSGDEVGAARGATCLSVVVRKPHALCRELVKVWRSTSHDALVVDADVRPSDVVAHDEDDVRPLLLRRRRPATKGRRKCSNEQQNSRYEVRSHTHLHMSALKPRLTEKWHREFRLAGHVRSLDPDQGATK